MTEIFCGSAGSRWRKMKKQDAAGAEALLRGREARYVSACGKFLDLTVKDTVWALGGGNGGPSALIVQSNQNLLPVFCGREDIPLPGFLRGFFSAARVHSVQGLKSEVITLQDAMEKMGLSSKEDINYHLMYIDHAPGGQCFSAGPPGLKIRRPQLADLDALAALQAAYEQEEVLPRGARFYPAVSRLNAERIFVDQQALAAELNGRLVGKINTSARSFSCFQIGGVYVQPGFRGLGIARRMAGEFTRSLIAQGCAVTLFVKNSNPPARAVYRRLGFEILDDYRIAYY